MASRDQFAPNYLPLASAGGGVKGAPALRALHAQPRLMDRPVRFPATVPTRRTISFCVVNRKWVHISYVLIDLLLISLSGVAAFACRFATIALLGAYLRTPVWP